MQCSEPSSNVTTLSVGASCCSRPTWSVGKGDTPGLESSCWMLSVAPVGRGNQRADGGYSVKGLVWVRKETEADAKAEDIQEVWGGCEGKGEADGEAGRDFDCTRSDACRGGTTEEVGGIVAHAIQFCPGQCRVLKPEPPTRGAPHSGSERCMFTVASRREPGSESGKANPCGCRGARTTCQSRE